jgi:hypothetical protein
MHYRDGRSLSLTVSRFVSQKSSFNVVKLTPIISVPTTSVALSASEIAHLPKINYMLCRGQDKYVVHGGDPPGAETRRLLKLVGIPILDITSSGSGFAMYTLEPTGCAHFASQTKERKSTTADSHSCTSLQDTGAVFSASTVMVQDENARRSLTMGAGSRQSVYRGMYVSSQ